MFGWLACSLKKRSAAPQAPLFRAPAHEKVAPIMLMITGILESWCPLRTCVQTSLSWGDQRFAMTELSMASSARKRLAFGQESLYPAAHFSYYIDYFLIFTILKESDCRFQNRANHRSS
jgi:hypothetical protein